MSIVHETVDTPENKSSVQVQLPDNMQSTPNGDALTAKTTHATASPDTCTETPVPSAGT